MENLEELKAHLMATSEEFRKFVSEHAETHRQLAALEGKEHLSMADEAEEHRLKKYKLHLKDQMNQVLSRYKEQVA
jgi:uncharacterized protein YdcH (DUF465 family)